LYADKTEAWGWRGIVQTQSHHVIAHDVPVRQIEDALLEQLDWGFAQSIECLDGPEMRAAAAQIAAQVRGWVTEFLADCSDHCRLSDLYQTLLPRFYELLLGAPPANFQSTASTELFRFNRDTCGRPRFSLLTFFLDPKTRDAACQVYNRAVSGSGIYTLDAFGEDAIPFDLVVPGQGRGTLRLTAQGVIIEATSSSITLGQGRDITSLPLLAALIEERYGKDAALVGKAVTLVDMLAAEFLVVFHETASGYTTATQAFNAALAEAGMPLSLFPLVRLAYPTWDALAAAPDVTRLRLPVHLVSAFGTETIDARQFAQTWQSTVQAQKSFLNESRKFTKARDLFTFLEGRDAQCWCDLGGEYEQALSVLKGLARQSDTLRGRVDEHREQLEVWKAERQELERRKGEDWRTHIQPLRERIRAVQGAGGDTRPIQRDIDRQIAVRATAFDEPLAVSRERIEATRALIAEFRRQRRLLERGPEAQQARAKIAEITRRAQQTRLELGRQAFLTIDGLEHTNLRPTAWWLPLVDPSGQWFAALADGTQARLESLV